MRALLSCLLFSTPLLAQDSYLKELGSIQREERLTLPGDAPDAPLDRAFIRYGEVAQKARQRWEAFMLRGLNRCLKALKVRGILSATIHALRARGASREHLLGIERDGNKFLDRCLKDAWAEFMIMKQRMQKLGLVDAERIGFANASMKFAKGEHLETERGDKGAIDDLKALMRRRFRPELCAYLIAHAYNELGAREFGDGNWQEAQEFWDKGLRFAADPSLRRIILTNKAGAYEMDNEFGLAEEVLRKQLEREEFVPDHWKNLGLLLGFQARYREALDAYGKCRQLCRQANAPFFLGLLHGNAWLRAAMIHGKLLDEDGDMLLAWRLFWEYRKHFGDDYNFSLAFGEFALHMDAYDIAYTYMLHAKNLQPFCPRPYVLLLDVAGRTEGTPQEVRERVERAKREFREARDRFQARDETSTLKRLCGGLRDIGDGGGLPDRIMRLDPDPLAGASPDKLPDWLVEVARAREPFRPFDPRLDRPQKSPESSEVTASVPEQSSGTPLWPIVGGAVVLLAAGSLALLVRMRRARAA